MNTHDKLRSISYVMFFVFFYLAIYVHAWSSNFAKDLAVLFLILGITSVFLITHYLCLIGQAMRSDFGLLFAIYISSMLLGFYYWPDGAEIIEVVSIIVLIILSVEYQWPDWFGTIRERLIKKET